MCSAPLVFRAGERAPENPSERRDVVAFLRQGGAYPERPARVECVETHISWVFLTPRCAYKLKKPARFEFLDFSTAELRREACQAEFRLNQRLAPDVYLGVLPITRERRGLALDGPGEPIDWVVKMRRLPAEQSLDRLIAARRLTPAHVRELADALATFYERSPPITARVEDYRRQCEAHVRANRAALLSAAEGNVAGGGPAPLDAALARRVHGAQLRLLNTRPRLLDDRVVDGRLVEGHGDLRPEHVYFTPEPTIIDCVEFSAELRRLDVLDELGFLAMECDALGAPRVGAHVLEEYCRRAGDQPPPELWAFYKSYRACVRAKVLVLRAGQVGDAAARERRLAQAGQYLRLAEGCLPARPLMVVARGLSGSGKSTLAGELAHALGLEHLQTDALRRELLPPGDDAATDEQRYSPENRERVYTEMFARAERWLAEGVSVALDGTFLAARHRRRASELAAARGAEFIMFECRCPLELAQQRIAERFARGQSLSEATAALAAAQQEVQEPDPPDLCSLPLDASQGLPTIMDEALARVAALPVGAPPEVPPLGSNAAFANGGHSGLSSHGLANSAAGGS